MRYLVGLAGGLVLAAVCSVAAEGATRYWTVTPDPAAPGDVVTDAIHDYGGGGPAFRGTDLYLISESRFTDGPLCSEMPGAIKVGVITWTDNGLYHDGLAQFTLPVVADGRYWLAEQVPGVISPCNPAGSITVSAGRSPDTAMARESGWGTLLTMGGLMILLASAAVARALLSRRYRAA